MSFFLQNFDTGDSMAKCTIIFTDARGGVDIRVEYDPAIKRTDSGEWEQGSPAQRMVAAMIEKLMDDNPSSVEIFGKRSGSPETERMPISPVITPNEMSSFVKKEADIG
jgi:hypothetical protein